MSDILKSIKQPKDVKKLPLTKLMELAAATRERIVEVVSQTGGHIAPSLGAVEIAIALLKIFDLNKDKVVWDVGHQSYAWKILTGRNERFHTLRSLDGISGFTNRDESPYDAFTTGHSSTSISAALGMACAAELQDEEAHHIAVIGDGALTGGMSFEALNHTGHIQPNRFLVILNDNAMSISKNVGGLQKYMARMMTSKSYNTLKQQIWDLSHNLPTRIRWHFIYGARKVEESMMNILVPNIIFEDLGFKYLGPIDGHDLKQLTSFLKRIRDNMVGPVLLHVVTQKGKGYPPAEEDASLFHGVGPFESASGKQKCAGSPSWNDVFGKKLCAVAEGNQNIVAITAAMTVGTGLSGFEEKYPERLFDVGIAEQHAVTMAAGMAAKGIKPFVAIYSTFLQRALDQIIHDVALPRLPVVFCIDRAGLVGEDGATHHGVFDLSYLGAVPGLTILAPSTAEELEAMLAWAAQYMDGPVAIRYPRGTATCQGEEVTDFQPGIAKLISKEGKLGLIGVGDAFHIAQKVADLLTEKGYPCRLIDLRSVKPLDTKLLSETADECSHIFTFETNSIIGGAGTSIVQLLCDKPCRIVNFGYPDSFVPHGKIELLNERLGFTPAALTQKILDLIEP